MKKSTHNNLIQITDKGLFKPEIEKSEDEWLEELGQDSYAILRKKGTERAFTGIYDKHAANGEYLCAGCGNRLFSSLSKFNSGCGWPSFDQPIEAGGITYLADNSFGMRRIEIICTACGGHLGHVFDDGPTETGLRYCVNSASLSFTDK